MLLINIKLLNSEQAGLPPVSPSARSTGSAGARAKRRASREDDLVEVEVAEPVMPSAIGERISPTPARRQRSTLG